MGLIRVLLVGDRTMDRIAMESRLSIDDRIVVETVGDICSAASLVEWRHYSLVVVNVFGLGRSLVHLINNFSQHSRQPWIAFWGGRSTAMVRAAEMIAEARGVGVLKGGAWKTPLVGARISERSWIELPVELWLCPCIAVAKASANCWQKSWHYAANRCPFLTMWQL
jgi:hypothetical protein